MILIVYVLQISSVLLNSSELKVPSSLSPARLAELAHLLPLLGVTFLQDLTPSQLQTVLPSLHSVTFSPAQVEEHTAPVTYSGKYTHSVSSDINIYSFFFLVMDGSKTNSSWH